ncbi:MAG: 30S ribosomal protein S3, partial [Phycisphaerales bacterium]
ELTIIVKTARPGLVIGPKGQEIDQLTQSLQALTGRKVSVKIIEIQNPDTDATLIAEAVAEQLKKRANFRRLVKQRCEGAMQAGAKGVRILLAGRLGGSEMSRRLDTRLGSLPLSTLQANIDYAMVHSLTKQGTIGVKVWVFKGMYTDQEDEQAASKAAGARARARGRR